MKLSESNAWYCLKEQAKSPLFNSQQHQMSEAYHFVLSACNITIDFSNQPINTATLKLLLSLAEEQQLHEKIQHLMRGEKINRSENRPALHTALRAPVDTPIEVDGCNIMDYIFTTKHAIRVISEKIRDNKWLGYSGKPITDIINIGVGGSDIGPRFCLQALFDDALPTLRYHFISDADPCAFSRATANLQPETTLFIVASKSFTTEESLYNASKAKAWIGDSQHHKHHFIAVTAEASKAQAFGIDTVLPIWSWIGGRYSFCSAINLITAIAIGYDRFEQLLAGAHSMDQHASTRDFSANLPVLLALFGIWNNNFLNIHTLLMLVYAQQLESFVPYIQQLDMESNGKSRDNQGNPVDYATSPIIWGGLGNQALHSYYQLLCQGTHHVTLDVISIDTFANEMINAMCDAKIQVLTQGIHEPKHASGFILGQTPLNHIRLHDCSPYTIGALVALYEHKIFAQSVIWDINPFDQPGVESSKQRGLG